MSHYQCSLMESCDHAIVTKTSLSVAITPSFISDVPDVRRVHPPRGPARLPGQRPLVRHRRLLLLRRLQQVPHGSEDDEERPAHPVLERVRAEGGRAAAGQGECKGEDHARLIEGFVKKSVCTVYYRKQSSVQSQVSVEYQLFDIVAESYYTYFCIYKDNKCEHQ